MDDNTDKMSSGQGKKVLNPFALKKPKKRSLVERELETNMTSRMISPVTVSDGVSTSRYGRARRTTLENDKNTSVEMLKSPTSENTPVKVSSGSKDVRKALETSLDNIDNIYQENKTLSRFNSSGNSRGSAKKVYIQRDLIQNRDDDDDDGIVLIKDLFSSKGSPKVTPKTASKRNTVETSSKGSPKVTPKTATAKKNTVESSSKKPQPSSKKQNGQVDNLSVVKTLDFDSNKNDKKNEAPDTEDNNLNNSNIIERNKTVKGNDEVYVKPTSSELFDIESNCPYQVGDLAWARMGNFPFWPCIITKDPARDVFVKRKLFGRVERSILHVTFFADNGRRSWVVDNMLREYKGLDEFKSTREKFTTEDKKKDPRLYAAFFISEKKQSLWNTSVEEAEMINREPKRTRIDAFNELLYKYRETKKLKSGKICRTDSDVSLSESLFDSLFSEDDSKDDYMHTRNRSKNRSLDVSDVVTACLDNMAAKTGNSKIQRQSHMDRWLQKAKSKTPEKVKGKNEQTPIKTPAVVPKTEPLDSFAAKVEDITPIKDNIFPKTYKPEKPVNNRSKKRKLPLKEVKITKVYSLRRSYESQNSFVEESKHTEKQITQNDTLNESTKDSSIDISKEKISDSTIDSSSSLTSVKVADKLNTSDKSEDILNAIDEILDDTKNNKLTNCNETREEESIKTSTNETIETLNIEIKPEIMDIDENEENNVKYAEKSTDTDNIDILDSDVKIEKRLTSQVSLENGNVLNNDKSPIKTLNGTNPVKANSTPKKSSSPKDKTNRPSQTSPLKNNEMVLIPENINLTDDDNSMTHLISFDDVNHKSVNMYDSSNSENDITKSDIGDLNDSTCAIINDDTLASTEKQNTTTNEMKSVKNTDVEKVNTEKFKNKSADLNQNDMSIDEIADEDINMTEKDVLNESSTSESILQMECTNSIEEPNQESKIGHKETSKNNERESVVNCNSILQLNRIDQQAEKDIKSNPFLDDSRNTDCVDAASNKEHFFRETDMNKPPDLSSRPINNVDDSDCCDNEDSDDEPSPEFEPLEDEIKEDFRQHMICIESNITDKKDDAQWVKLCNDIAVLEESKVKLNDIKLNATLVYDKNIKAINKHNSSLSDEQILSEMSLGSDELGSSPLSALNTHVNSKEIKTEFLDSNNISESVENSLKSPLDKKKYKLSLRRLKSLTESTNSTKPAEVDRNLDSFVINPMYKTIDQIEEIMKSKPKRLPLENDEICIGGIIENGFTRETDVPEVEDDDFNIDNASISSEDSEISLTQTTVPARRSLRSKERRVGLQDPEFLTYLELRQDGLMEQHPELSIDDIILYLYKTFTYSQNIQPEIQLEESPLKVKQETTTSKQDTLSPKQETRSKSKKSKKRIQPKNTIENFFRDKYNKSKKIDIKTESPSFKDDEVKRESPSVSPVDSGIGNSKDCNEIYTPKSKRKSRSITPRDTVSKEIKLELTNIISQNKSPKTPKRLRKKMLSPRTLACSADKRVPVVVISPMNSPAKVKQDTEQRQDDEHADIKQEIIPETDVKPETNELDKITDGQIPKIENKAVPQTKQEDTEPESIESDSEIPLRQLRSKVIQEKHLIEPNKDIVELKEEEDTASVSSDNVPLLKLRPKKDKSLEGSYEDPEFLKYMELKQDALSDENPHLTQNEIKAYLYKTWIYDTESKSDLQKNDEIELVNLVKGLNPEPIAPKRNSKRKTKVEKVLDDLPKEKPRRKTLSHYYNEELLSDAEEELEVFEIFKTKKAPITVVSKPDSPKKERVSDATSEDLGEAEIVAEEINTLDDVELYFKQLISPKPSVFKGLIREKVCGICEDVSNLVKCKNCNGMFHFDCVNRAFEITDSEKPCVVKGRKKKRKTLNGRKSNENEESEDIVDEPASMTVDATLLESQFEATMKELMEKDTNLENYDSYSSEEEIDWTETVPGKCEVIDVKLKRRDPPIDVSNFKCHNCRKYDKPICFVCKSAVSKNGVEIRQKCTVAQCNVYYHLECLDHWPQTQFHSSEWSRTKVEKESLTCPRHVCHTCVSDDPRGCKTRFSSDKLAKCVRCPATYHAFSKCLPAGTQILTASFIICPRHYEHRPGKVPCHVNTGWCFICALGGSLICCEYCPTSFHAECLNIKPPEGNYMCEDCETGRLPLYGEMVWVKLGHYRWWPGVILHPSEIPDNIMAVKHGLGEFVVRFFGQYDHYWVNRGRVFPYQEGDSGRVSGQRSKIDAAFTTAMEHAQRAYRILKDAQPDDEESQEISSSLLPPHFVKLKCNKPTGSLLGRKVEDPSLSLTQCECNPADCEPCGANSQCLNRVLLTECGPTCRAGERCHNRAFERRLYPRLAPYRATHRGWGLKTLDDIKAGQFVIEYVGELIDEKEFQWRMKRKHEIRDENFYFLTLDKERMIDAGPKGNLARFMNHCCEPNCETQKWTVLGDVRVGLFALKDIKANSEVTFNYNLECSGIEKKRCLCGAARCAGYIGAKPKQPNESQTKKNGITGKRKYTKRKDTEGSPSTSKNKAKRPLGRPRKEKSPKELTEIEKDLLIIKSATPNSDESRPQSEDDKKIDSKLTTESQISNDTKEESSTIIPVINGLISNKDKVLKTKLDPNSTEEVKINGIETKLQRIMNSLEEGSKPVKRKASNDEVISNSEPCAKRLKSDKRIEVGD